MFIVVFDKLSGKELWCMGCDVKVGWNLLVVVCVGDYDEIVMLG